MPGLIVKICGITRESDAVAAADLGATHIGLIFAPGSPRKIDVVRAKSISKSVAGRVKVVGVFQNQERAHIEDIQRQLQLDAVQYHGDETATDFTKQAPAIKAISHELSMDQMEMIEASASMLLFDKPKGSGGWSDNWPAVLQDYLSQRELLLPFLVAGGIEANNAAEFVKQFDQHKSFAGIDIASGVEIKPGIKDEQKLKALFSALKEGTGHANSR